MKRTENNLSVPLRGLKHLAGLLLSVTRLQSKRDKNNSQFCVQSPAFVQTSSMNEKTK